MDQESEEFGSSLFLMTDRGRRSPRHYNTLALNKSPEPWPKLWRVWGKPRKMKLSHQPRGRMAQNRN